MDVKLYVVPSSHPCNTARLMLEHKGIEYRRVDLIPLIAKAYLRLRGFPGSTVPALEIDGRKIQGTLNMSRELERIKPQPALFPEDSEMREKVEEAERWGDAMLQPIPRRIIWWCMKKDRTPMAGFIGDARIGVPTGLAVKLSAPIAAAMAMIDGSTDEAVRADLAHLPGVIDHVDRLIEEGVIGGEEPNAADFQIAITVRLLLCFEDLRPFLIRRPAKDLAMRIHPDLSGNIGPSFPSEWLAPINANNTEEVSK